MTQSIFRRRHLPHWDVVGGTYFVTACLDGSIPAQGLSDIRRYQEQLEQRPRPENLREDEWMLRCWKLLFTRTEHWLDLHAAVRHLADERLAQNVIDSMQFFSGERYDLIAYVVMPSHFHWLFRPKEEWVATLPSGPPTPRERVMHSVKRHSARQCNLLLNKQGTFWQDESYDHWVRDDQELERIVDYIERNPVKAGLVTEAEQWAFSSALVRALLGIRAGEALPLRRTGL